MGEMLSHHIPPQSCSISLHFSGDPFFLTTLNVSSIKLAWSYLNYHGGKQGTRNGDISIQTVLQLEEQVAW